MLTLVATMATAVATLPGAAQATSTTCSTSVVCAEDINTYSGSSGGVAIHGEANGGIGVRGTSVSNTGFYGASGSGTMLAPGVEGESTNGTSSATLSSAGGFGLAGLAGGTYPGYGVLGYGNLAGVNGETTSPGTSSTAYGIGVSGYDAGGTSANDYNVGVLGSTANGVGVLGEANGTPTAGLIGHGYTVGLYAVAHEATNKYGVVEYGAVGIESESDDYPLELRNTESDAVAQLVSPYYLFNAYTGQENFANGTYFYVNYSGDARLSGTLTTSKGTYARTRGRSGTARLAYGARTTAPTIEDVGGGQLVGGRAVVQIDAAFADTIDSRRPYRIFLTPQGDCNGLYVAEKNPGRFVVRELHAGRSSIAFDYRIVAKPADDDGSRLAAVPLVTPAQGPRTPSPEHVATPLSPDELLRSRTGPQGYARAIGALRQRLSER
jgi:hypothetical protein